MLHLRCEKFNKCHSAYFEEIGYVDVAIKSSLYDLSNVTSRYSRLEIFRSSSQVSTSDYKKTGIYFYKTVIPKNVFGCLQEVLTIRL